MKRREFITLLGGSVAWPFAARGQQVTAKRLGVLSVGVPTDLFTKNNTTVFVQGLSALGWREGANLAVDWRWYGTDTALAERLAAEIVAMKPDAIFTSSNPAVEKIRLQTKSIPVVFTLVSDPVGMGYVDSLRRPGGNGPARLPTMAIPP